MCDALRRLPNEWLWIGVLSVQVYRTFSSLFISFPFLPTFFFSLRLFDPVPFPFSFLEAGAGTWIELEPSFHFLSQFYPMGKMGSMMRTILVFPFSCYPPSVPLPLALPHPPPLPHEPTSVLRQDNPRLDMCPS